MLCLQIYLLTPSKGSSTDIQKLEVLKRGNENNGISDVFKYLAPWIYELKKTKVRDFDKKCLKDGFNSSWALYHHPVICSLIRKKNTWNLMTKLRISRIRLNFCETFLPSCHVQHQLNRQTANTNHLKQETSGQKWLKTCFSSPRAFSSNNICWLVHQNF